MPPEEAWFCTCVGVLEVFLAVMDRPVSLVALEERLHAMGVDQPLSIIHLLIEQHYLQTEPQGCDLVPGPRLLVLAERLARRSGR